MGLLLFDHYRYQLCKYLKKLDAESPGVVNKPIFNSIERIGAAIPGAHKSDLWLQEAVDPALKDFSAMNDHSLREKVAIYVRLLKEYNNSVQWTLFMPEFVSKQIKGFKIDNFEYLDFPAMRFLVVEGDQYEDVEKRVEAIRTLDAMHSSEGFDCNAMYDVTRNIILGDGVNIPYPE